MGNLEIDSFDVVLRADKTHCPEWILYIGVILAPACDFHDR